MDKLNRKMTVTLIICILIVVMVADFKINGGAVFESYFKQLETGSMREINNLHEVEFRSENASKNTVLEADTAGISSLNINNKMGTIIISGEDRKNVRVTGEITVYAVQEEQARAYIEKLKLSEKKLNDKLQIILEEPDRPDYIKGVKVRYKIRAPENMNLNLHNRLGELTADNFNGNVKLNNRYDTTSAENISGKVTVISRFGNLNLKNIRGETRVNSGYGKFKIVEQAGNLKLDTEFCDLDIYDLSNDATVKTKYSSIDLGDSTGNIHLDSRFTDVIIDNLTGKISADMEYGNFRVNNIIEDVNIRSRFTDLNLDLSETAEGFEIAGSIVSANFRSDLPLTIKEEGNLQKVTGILGTGAVKVLVESERGDVSIRK